MGFSPKMCQLPYPNAKYRYQFDWKLYLRNLLVFGFGKRNKKKKYFENIVLREWMPGSMMKQCFSCWYNCAERISPFLISFEFLAKKIDFKTELMRRWKEFSYIYNPDTVEKPPFTWLMYSIYSSMKRIWIMEILNSFQHAESSNNMVIFQNVHR